MEPWKNRILATLPAGVRDDFGSRMQADKFAPNHVMLEEHAPIARVYFPVNGVISVVGAMEDGSTAESYTAGSDGMFGADLLLGADRIVQRTTCQVPGTFYSMSAADFVELAKKYDVFAKTVLQYVHCLMALTGQSAACNLLHDLIARCARWLLLVQDRVYSDDFTLTHDILATMLGVHRPAVSVAAGTLQKAGFIRYTRGHITITDRAGLESASCECYRLISEAFDRILPRA